MNKLLAVIFALSSQAVLANPEISSWSGPYEYKLDSTGHMADSAPIDDDVWEKYDYPVVDAELYLVTYWQSDQLYGIPDNGSQWTLSLKDPATNRAYDNYTLTYNAATNCLVGDDGWELCSAIQPRGTIGAKYSLIRIAYAFKCLAVRPWLYTGTTPDGSSQDMSFAPIRYRVKVSGPSMNSPIQPHIPATGDGAIHMIWPEVGPETSTVRLLATDDLDCGERLKDVAVDIESRVTGGAGHAHFTGDVGTGRFTDAEGHLVDPRSITATHIQGRTGDDGQIAVYYTAGELGVTETMVAIAKQEAVSVKDPESTAVSYETLAIRYPWLAELPTSAADGSYFLSYTTDGCPHDPQAHWLNQGMRAAVMALAGRYLQEYCAPLSLNDGSLPYGGLIDNAHSGGRNASCHTSHRRGIDVDVNHSDALLLTVGYTPEGLAITRQDKLDSWATEMHIPRYPENGSIHYRWW